MPPWPSLPYEEWRDTRDTLHMYTQVIGKIRLTLAPLEPEWANVPLYVTPRGLGTSAIPFGLQCFDIEFDFVEHELVIRSSDGGVDSIALRGQDVADFYHEVLAALGRLGISVTINELPQEVPDPIPFPDDRTHHAYDPTYAHRFWQVLVRVDTVMKRYRATFTGKASAVHFFWGTFDLATTRFSGRAADPPPGSGVIMRLAEDAEQVSQGFWPGDERMPSPGFYAYGYPQPAGCDTVESRPSGTAWNDTARLFVLPYDTVREAQDPAAALTQFLESTYENLSGLMGWSPGLVAAGRHRD